MNCVEIRDVLTAVVDGEATVLERALVERHLEACASCGRSLRLARAMKEALASIPAPPLPAELRAVLSSEARRAKPRAPAFLTLAAAACLAAALLMLAGGDQEPEETIPVEAMLSVHQACVRGGSLDAAALPAERAPEDADVL